MNQRSYLNRPIISRSIKRTIGRLSIEDFNDPKEFHDIVRACELADFKEEKLKEEYMSKYQDICRRLNSKEIEYDDLTNWEQDLCTYRGVRSEAY